MGVIQSKLQSETQSEENSIFSSEKVSAADDEMAQKKLEDRKLCRRDQENKLLLLASESKCSQVERKKTHMSNVVKTIPEDKYRKMQDDLKLKNDKFNDLVKAHQKLRYEFRLSELEWDLRAKSVSYDLLVIKQEICKLSLNLKLDVEKLYEDIFEKCREQQSKIVQKNKNMLGESSKRKQMLFEECVMKIEEVSECEMAEKTHEPQSWKNDDEVPKSSFEGQLEIEQASDQEIENLKSGVKEHEEKIGDLQHQVTSLELISPAKDDATYTMVEEKNL